MIKWIKSFYVVESNSLCPNSLAPMPDNKFHNYAIEQREHEDDDEPNENVWSVFKFDINKYNKNFRKNIFYTMYDKK